MPDHLNLTPDKLPEGKIAWKGAAGLVTLIQQGRNRFAVRYGLQIKADLTYGEATRELGIAIMHYLSCEGKVDNSD